MHRNIQIALTPALLLGLVGAAAAQDQQQDAQDAAVTAEIVPIAEWVEQLSALDGWSVAELIENADVWGADGEDIGDVENVVFDADGSVLSLVVEVGGLWEIGDTHASVPWSEVEAEFGPSLTRVTVPITEDNIGNYSVFSDELLSSFEAAGDITEVSGDGPGVVGTGARAFRATDLLQDYVRIVDGDRWINFGYIDDVIVQEGEIAAVAVRPDLAYAGTGVYAYPYFGYDYGWTPGSPYYDMPYALSDIERLEPVPE